MRSISVGDTNAAKGFLRSPSPPRDHLPGFIASMQEFYPACAEPYM